MCITQFFEYSTLPKPLNLGILGIVENIKICAQLCVVFVLVVHKTDFSVYNLGGLRVFEAKTGIKNLEFYYYISYILYKINILYRIGFS